MEALVDNRPPVFLTPMCSSHSSLVPASINISVAYQIYKKHGTPLESGMKGKIFPTMPNIHLNLKRLNSWI